MSWAAIAKAEPVKAAPKEEDTTAKPRIAVVDANVIINGEHLLSLMRCNDRVVTVPEVLREVRDKQSRQTLQNLPYTIQTQEPAEESVKAVMRFARATGDVHALSAVDVRLLALAHTLEVGYYGGGHLRQQPPPPRVAKKKARDSKLLPGWGAEGGDWAEMDRLNEEELAAAEAALMAGQSSRISATLQQLTLGGNEAAAGSASRLGIALSTREGAAGTEQSAAAASPQVPGGPAGPEANGAGQAAAAAEGGSDSGSESDEEGGGEDEEGGDEDEDGEGGEGEWVTAARTRNVQRRRRRREIRRAQWQLEQQAAEAAEAAAAAAEAESSEGEGEGASSSDGEDGSGSEADEEEGEGEEGQGGEAGAGRADSAVCSVTADFAMQNVLLQMGLRLATPDGRRVSQLSRWVLRCTACFGVTKEMGRLFCPKCGNASLDKVRVVVGPDGAEQYGVRKKHILRGTKFALPKPKGGRANDLILREDQLLAKMHRLRKKKGAQEELDPFAPEYTDETWHQTAALPGGAGAKGAAALLAGWKHNPNERKHVATNRRRK